jgi:peptide-methionine (S)-S-oxide reductase
MRFIQVVLAVAAVLACGATKTEQTQTSHPKELPMNTDTATFAAGCFWGVQAEFDKVKGVVQTTVGYTGGHTERPTYRDVCSDQTGHAEAVQVVYDPTIVTYEQLLDKFWSMHDPTTSNQQGPDFGSQYRSVIFYHSPEQQAAAVASKEKLDKAHRFPRPIVTQVLPAATFWPAEEYHQKYFQKHGGGSCHI